MPLKFRLLVCAAVAPLASPALAQQIVYDNSGNLLAWWAQVPPGEATGPEAGDQITLGEQGRFIQQFEFWYHVGGTNESGTADIQVRFYANDGPGGIPGTILWSSPLQQGVGHISGTNHLALPVPSIIMPDSFTWTVTFTNRTGSAAEGLGLRIYDPPLVGQSDPQFIWLSDPQLGFVQAAFPGAVPSNLGARVIAAGAPVVGACCFADTSCIPLNVVDCHAVGGHYSPGTCTTAPCPVPAACCFSDGWCLELTEAGCQLAQGVWSAPGVSCPALCADEPLFANGPLATGKVRSDLVHAPYDAY
jgi:hypothetical protein